MKHFCPDPARQAGLTLVELLIALTIGLFLVGAVSTLYVKTRSGFDYNNEISKIQETGRFAFDVLGRDIRNAGFIGCGRTSTLVNVVTNASSDPFEDFSTPIKGYNGTGYPSAMVNTASQAPVSGSDALILQGLDNSREVVVKQHAPPVLTTGTNTFQVGEILMATDCSKASIFRASAVSATTISHAAVNNCKQTLNLGCSQTSTKLTATFKPGSLVTPVYSNAYFIAPSANGTAADCPATVSSRTKCSLWAMQMSGETDGTPTAREILVGVTDMQITYGIDNTPDISNVAKVDTTTASPSDWSRVVSLTIALTVRSEKTNKTGAQGLIEKTFNETFIARNRAL